ncbi:hypothetical protein B0H11DRAFT_1918673 [Mycena galericulata]|nr:hypothetical protein B0H11DRAFT_1918673 [Mycena galericulata]
MPILSISLVPLFAFLRPSMHTSPLHGVDLLQTPVSSCGPNACTSALLHIQVFQGKTPPPTALDAIAILVTWSLYSRSPPAKKSAIFDHISEIFGVKSMEDTVYSPPTLDNLRKREKKVEEILRAELRKIASKPQKQHYVAVRTREKICEHSHRLAFNSACGCPCAQEQEELRRYIRDLLFMWPEFLLLNIMEVAR